MDYKEIILKTLYKVQNTITQGKSATVAMKGSTEEEQFEESQ